MRDRRIVARHCARCVVFGEPTQLEAEQQENVDDNKV